MYGLQTFALIVCDFIFFENAQRIMYLSVYAQSKQKQIATEKQTGQSFV